MNIKIQSLNLFSNNGLKSTQERLDRQAKRDNQIAFFEQQKENLKNMKADSIEDISRKLDLLHGYDDYKVILIYVQKILNKNVQMI